MKKIFPLFLVLSILFFSCEKEKIGDIPACLKVRIEQIKKQPKWNPPAEINEYEYNGQTVYLISADCCDQYDTLVDSNCKFICAPGGGITGSGDNKCKDFSKNAKLIRLVWKDER